MLTTHTGELAALATAVFWTITALAFTSAGKRIGSLSVNFWRLVVGILLISAFVFLSGNHVFPQNIHLQGWIWLSLSGIVGIFLGDLFLFKAFTLTGPRVALLVMSFSPPVAAVISFLFLGDMISFVGIIGMIVTLTGIVLVVLGKRDKNKDGSKKLKMKYDKRGLFFALLGAVGQAAGLVMSKQGLVFVENPFVATQIRLYAGLVGFIFLIAWMRRWNQVMLAFKDMKAFGVLSVGAFFGPFLGISFSLIAVKYTNPGIVQTIAGLTPVLIIPFAYFIQKEKVGIRDILGAVIAVSGVSLFLLF